MLATNFYNRLRQFPTVDDAICYIQGCVDTGGISFMSGQLIDIGPSLNEPQQKVPSAPKSPRASNLTLQKILTAISAAGTQGVTTTSLVSTTGLTKSTIVKALSSRAGKTQAITQSRRWYATGVQPTTAAPASQVRGQAAKSSGATGSSTSNAVLQAVQNIPNGATNAQVSDYLSKTLGMNVRANHVGIALQRHRRASRLQQRSGKWYMPDAGQSTTQAPTNLSARRNRRTPAAPPVAEQQELASTGT